MPIVRIDGPFGAPSEDVFKSELAILVGAGVGISPFASILKHIWYRQRQGKLHRLRRVELIWVVRDLPSFGWFQSVLQDVEDAQVDRECHLYHIVPVVITNWCLFVLRLANFLRINMYITQPLELDQIYNLTINDAGATYDPLTHLRSRTFYGRPDFTAIYSRIRNAVQAGAFLGPRESGTITSVGVRIFPPSFS